MIAPKPNTELAYRVLDHIDADPESWMQDVWIYNAGWGTAACMAGRTCLLSGDIAHYEDEDSEAEEIWVEGGRTLSYIPSRAARLLGIPLDGGERTGYRLFEPKNTREDLGRLVEEIFGPRPIDWDQPLVPVMGVPASGCDCSHDGVHGLAPWPDRERGHAEDCPAHGQPSAGSAS